MTPKFTKRMLVVWSFSRAAVLSKRLGGPVSCIDVHLLPSPITHHNHPAQACPELCGPPPTSGQAPMTGKSAWMR